MTEVTEYATTFGLLQWDDGLNYVKSHDDPQPPKGDGWTLVTTCLGALGPTMGPGKQLLVWTWQREVGLSAASVAKTVGVPVPDNATAINAAIVAKSAEYRRLIIPISYEGPLHGGAPVPRSRPHLVNGEFQSDKYPSCPRGKVPMSCKDNTAQDLLWTYAQRRRAVDAEFADDLEEALRIAGYVPQIRVPGVCVECGQTGHEKDPYAGWCSKRIHAPLGGLTGTQSEAKDGAKGPTETDDNRLIRTIISAATIQQDMSVGGTRITCTFESLYSGIAAEFKRRADVAAKEVAEAVRAELIAGKQAHTKLYATVLDLLGGPPGETVEVRCKRVVAERDAAVQARITWNIEAGEEETRANLAEARVKELEGMREGDEAELSVIIQQRDKLEQELTAANLAIESARKTLLTVKP